MTKSEAKAIDESCIRALRLLNGVMFDGAPGIPWNEMAESLKERVYAALRPVIDEVQRVHAMASAEISPVKK